MTEKRYRRRLAVPILLLVLCVSYITGCRGTLEIGVVNNYPPDSTATPAEGDEDEATPTAWGAGGTFPATPAPTAGPTQTPIPASTEVRVAFVNVTEHGNNVWLWTEGEGAAVPLTRDGGVGNVKISEDGEIVAFTRGDGLWMVRTDGTDERELVSAEDFPAMEARDPGLEVALNRFEWVPGTHALAFNTRLRMEIGLVLNDDLHLVNAATLERTALLAPGEGGEFHYAPDGSQVAVVTPGKISLVDADGGNRREALTYLPVATASEFRYYARPVWAPDSRSLQVAVPPVDPYADPPQLTSIWRIPADGTPGSLLTSIRAMQISRPAFSPDQRYVVHLHAEQVDPASSAYPESDLLVTDLTLDATVTYYPQADAQITLDSGETITHRPMVGEIHGWAPDGQHFAFAAQPDPELPFQAQIGKLGGEVVPAYSESAGAVVDVRWVDADRYLLLAQNPKGWDVLLARIGGSSALVGFVGGSGAPPSYDYAAPPVDSPLATPTPANPPPTPAVDDSGESPVPFGLIYQTTDGLYHVNVDGESARILDPSGTARPAISPSGAQVLYHADDDIWVADVATGERQNVTQTPDRAECCAGWWPSQPEVILFSSWPIENVGHGFGFPTTARLDGSAYRVLDEEQVSYAEPAPAPDGQTVAYDRAGKPWLYRQGTGVEPFDWTLYGLGGEGELRIVSPAWSPDGRRLAWVVNDCSAGPCQDTLGVFELGGQTVQLLHPHSPAGRGGQPPAAAWSPDGRWLAFVAWAENLDEAGLWVARTDGEQEKQRLDGGARGDHSPIWSPDGRWLAFSSSPQGVGSGLWLAEVETWTLHSSDLPPDAYPVAWVSPR